MHFYFNKTCVFFSQTFPSHHLWPYNIHQYTIYAVDILSDVNSPGCFRPRDPPGSGRTSHLFLDQLQAKQKKFTSNHVPNNWQTSPKNYTKIFKKSYLQQSLIGKVNVFCGFKLLRFLNSCFTVSLQICQVCSTSLITGPRDPPWSAPTERHNVPVKRGMPGQMSPRNSFPNHEAMKQCNEQDIQDMNVMNDHVILIPGCRYVSNTFMWIYICFEIINHRKQKKRR